MTDSRPPGSSRHADARNADRDGSNPLQRPLPPGLARRPGERDLPGRPAASPSPSGSAAASPFRAPTARPARDPSALGTPAADRAARPAAAAFSSSSSTAAPGGPAGTSRRARSESRTRAAVDASAIPLMAPPAWQIEETEAEERQLARERAVASQRGLPGWLGLVVLLAITGVGGLIDAIAGAGIKGAFSIGLIVGSLAAILLVRRSSMFPIVVAPPLVYFVASAVLLYVRSGGLSNRAAITDAAASWLVYGFPAIAGATAVVLIVAGVRMILHR